MAVKLRLRRMGQKKQPLYKIVAADARSPRDGRFIEAVGSYNPLTNPPVVTINSQKVMRWLSQGAAPTDTVRSLLKKDGLWLRWDLARRGKTEEQISAITEKVNQARVGKSERVAAKKARRVDRKKKAAAPKEA